MERAVSAGCVLSSVFSAGELQEGPLTVSPCLRGWLVCTDGRKAGQRVGGRVKPQKPLDKEPLWLAEDTE